MTEFRLALRALWLALRGGQADTLALLAEHEERLMPLYALGADVDARVRDAILLEQAGVPSSEVEPMARAWMLRGAEAWPEYDR